MTLKSDVGSTFTITFVRGEQIFSVHFIAEVLIAHNWFIYVIS